MKILRKFEPTKGVSKIGLCNKFSKCKVYDITRNSKEWITEIEILRVYIKKLDLYIDNSETMTSIILNLPEE